MRQYLELLDDVLASGESRDDRTGVGTLSVFGRQARYNLQEGFPLLTTKKLHLKSIIYELLWMINGDTNVQYLRDHGVTIWDEWADERGNLGPVYGKQWRNVVDDCGYVTDQLMEVIDSLKREPHSRRHIVSAWNVAELPEMALPPCHAMFQFYVSSHGLSLQLYQRSADIFLGVPFNIASYALLTSMVAQVCGYKPYEFIHTFGDLHLYKNHIEQAKLQLTREPMKLPTLRLNPDVDDIRTFEYDDIKVEGYQAHPHIKADVAV